MNMVNQDFIDGRKPKRSELKEALANVSAKVREVRPTYIIPLGASVTTILTGKKAFMAWVGRSIQMGKWNVIPILHPDFAKKQKSNQRLYAAHLHNALAIIAGDGIQRAPVNYHLAMEEGEICDLLAYYSRSTQVVAFDWETTSLDPDRGVPICLNLSSREHTAAVVYWYAEKGGVGLTPRIKKAVTDFLISNAPKVAHYAKFEIKWSIRHFGVEPANLVGDPAQMIHLLDENSTAGLKDLAYQYTDIGGYDNDMADFLAQPGNTHADIDPHRMREYGGGDADATLRIYNALRPKIDADKGLRWVERNIVMPAVHTLARMELRGMKVDWDATNGVKKESEETMGKLLDEIMAFPAATRACELMSAEIAGNAKSKKPKKIERLNPGSPDQMAFLLFEVLRLPIVEGKKKKNKSGQPSTEKTALELLVDKHPIVQKILTYREHMHELATLVQWAAKKREDGTTFSDLVEDYTATGRLASRKPNLQNIPSKSALKKCVVSRFPGGTLLQADYSQLELRLVTSEAGDDLFLGAFFKGTDVHTVQAEDTARKRGESYAKYDKELQKVRRRESKVTTFGTVYGIQSQGLSRQLRCTEDEAEAQLELWWQSHPKIRQWIKRNIQTVKQDGCIRNRVGRIRHIEGIDSDKWWVRGYAERTAGNSPIQSLGADITMWGMVNVDRALREHGGLKSVVFLQIHDSVFVDIAPGEKNIVLGIVQDVMIKQANALFSFLRVPLVMNFEVGESWADLLEIEGVKDVA